ncbi:hypothetical protein EZJ49_14860 [Bdellovibrio bacteriovorus]|uniref:hypothetical protein n=1 Tax=Bdellovibrio bacteriovorus TaxID=959 RepID=UPI0021CEF44D|nr:hypothetical protein [Bdellovibrio bacteriovorus]UXR64347.1 hypothetical protein EZJ49_14860 [Bdellovibrio bacteriovorus]
MFQRALSQIKNNWPLTGFIVVGLVAFIAGPKSEKEDVLQALPSPASVDTYIPRGFVLVPLEISNAESLASLVGDMGGVVDLYLASNDRQKGGLKVGSKLKLLRAPLNPEQYAVLVKDTESSRLLGFNGPFLAVVQNPDEKGTEVTSSASAPRLKVDYQN